MLQPADRSPIPEAEAPRDCPLCPRLVALRHECRAEHPGWWNAPVPVFGDPQAWLAIVGLAPGKQGANRTGRPFTGDYAGELLYATLAKFGLSEGRFAADPNDGVSLKGAVILNKAVGGAGREFANAVALVESPLDPPAMLAALKAIERKFGRRPGRRWGERVLDLDIVAWSGGRFASRGLTIPHPRLADRDFVLGPLAAVAPSWPISGALTPRHLAARLGKRGRRR